MVFASLIFAVSNLLICILCRTWDVETYPNPQSDPARCGMSTVASICDPDDILTQEQEIELQGIMNSVRDGLSPFKKQQCGSLGAVGFQASCSGCYPPKSTSQLSQNNFALTARSNIYENFCVNL